MRRTWQLGPFTGDDGELYPISDQERDREMVSLGWMLDRMGGSAVIAPLRVRDGEGFLTAGLAVKYDSGNVPAVDVPRAEPKPEPEPELTQDELADHFPPAPEAVAEGATSDSPTPDEAPEPEPALAE
jgi:hypothetical protein